MFYVNHLRLGAQDYNFIWPKCDHDYPGYTSRIYIQNRANDMLHVDILAKAKLLKTLEQNVSHAEAFETIMQDQYKMSCILDIVALWMSTCH